MGPSLVAEPEGPILLRADTEQRERVVVRFEQHLVGLQRVAPQHERPAVAQPGLRHHQLSAFAAYVNIAGVTARLPKLIERVYNTNRSKSALRHRSPEEFEAHLAQQAD